MNIEVFPRCGSCLVLYCGDIFRIKLVCREKAGQKAFLRTSWTETPRGPAELDPKRFLSRGGEKFWRDLPMTEVPPAAAAPGEPLREFVIELPVSLPYSFEAKPFIENQTGELFWPEGENIAVQVQPAGIFRYNPIYTVFLRQWGPAEPEDRNRESEFLEQTGCIVLRPEGKLRDLEPALERISRMGFRHLLFLPVFPLSTEYGIRGEYGSPYAAVDFFRFNPAHAEFSKTDSPNQQFADFIALAHHFHLKVLIDIPTNHTGWGSRLQDLRSGFFERENGDYLSPGAWGVIWEDLIQLDYRQLGLWEYMARVFLYWAGQGVDGFRLDAGYKQPPLFWDYLVSAVRSSHPESIFLLEGLGGAVEQTRRILECGVNWAYSELFQNYRYPEVCPYLAFSETFSRRYGELVHFAETHDNNRLAAVSPAYARMRVALSALTSVNGCWGITNGVETYTTRKIDVHSRHALLDPRNYRSDEPGMEPMIRRLNSLLSGWPQFDPDSELVEITETDSGEPAGIAFLRRRRETADLLLLCNLGETPAEIRWDPSKVPMETVSLLFDSEDADSWERERPWKRESPLSGAFRLKGYQVLCWIGETPARRPDFPASALELGDLAAERQRLGAKYLELLRHYGRPAGTPDSLERGASDLGRDPERSVGGLSGRPVFRLAFPAPPLSPSEPGKSDRRLVLPSDFWLLVQSRTPFLFRAAEDGCVVEQGSALRGPDGSESAYWYLWRAPKQGKFYQITVRGMVPAADQPLCPYSQETELLSPLSADLTSGEMGSVPLRVSGSEIFSTEFLGRGVKRVSGLMSNSLGSYSLISADFGRKDSKYEGWLVVNPNRRVPDDRWTLWSNLRGWVKWRDFSLELGSRYLDEFRAGAENQIWWRFTFPFVGVFQVKLNVHVQMEPAQNLISCHFFLQAPPEEIGKIQLILRPQLENRNFHELNKAFGREEAYWSSLETLPDGLIFHSEVGALRFSGLGRYTAEALWEYNRYLPIEAERGQEAYTDLFSPGYFVLRFTEAARETEQFTPEQGSGVYQSVLQSEFHFPGEEPVREGGSAVQKADQRFLRPPEAEQAVGPLLEQALERFLVNRGSAESGGKSLLAGFPWFLDWSRDVLIALPGLISAGKLDEAERILRQFASFEREGTLPNLLRGEDLSNRNTSDAPLWFILSVRELFRKRPGILESRGNGRTLAEVTRSIVRHYRDGTPNGVFMDRESGLIYSPAHFSWMDTNFPACSPRQGYPIEIQVLWYAGLRFVGEILRRDFPEEAEEARELSGKVQRSIRRYYILEDRDWLSDCLHVGNPDQRVPAAEAAADDALRSNQLLALREGLLSGEEALRVLRSCQELIVPGAIRSLANRPLKVPLPVEWYGAQLNDPLQPYRGRYLGDEDTSRKPAYHNGTAWGWPFPLYAECLYRFGGESSRQAAMDLLLASIQTEMRLRPQGILGFIPEIRDGSAPHDFRGCPAQLWSISETLRVFRILSEGPAGRKRGE